MYDDGRRAGPSPVLLITWLVASALLLAAIVSMLWLFSTGGVRPPVAEDPATSASPRPVVDESGTREVSSDPDPSASPTPSVPATEPAALPVVAIQGVGSGRCLDVPGAVIADGATLQIYDCNGSVAQRWTVTEAGQLQVGGKCLDDPSGGATGGVPVAIYACHGGANQSWSTPGDGTVRNEATGMCLDVEAAGTENEARVNVFPCHGQPNQLWSVG